MKHYKLEIQNLTKRFGEKTLFENLNLTAEGPAILWAPSGWGKTTLLRILMGLETPTGGSVEGVGKVGAVFQEDRLCPQLNAVQNVELVLPEGKSQYKEQIEHDFQQLGLDEKALQLPARKLSGGQKRRAALLRALWAESDTLLLDEPFTGMDPETMKKAAALLKERPGEKLYEELMMDEEQDKMRRTEHNKIFVASPRDIDLAVFYQQLQDLAAAAQHNDEGVVDQLEKMIPTFTPTRKNLKV